MAARVREGRVCRARSRELRVELDAVPDIHHDNEGRASIGDRQGAGIGLGLAAGAEQAVIEALGVGRRLELLGLEDEGTATVEVDPAGAGGAIPMAEGNGPLEHVVLVGSRVRGIDVQEPAQVGEEGLGGR